MAKLAGAAALSSFSWFLKSMREGFGQSSTMILQLVLVLVFLKGVVSDCVPETLDMAKYVSKHFGTKTIVMAMDDLDEDVDLTDYGRGLQPVLVNQDLSQVLMSLEDVSTVFVTSSKHLHDMTSVGHHVWFIKANLIKTNWTMFDHSIDSKVFLYDIQSEIITVDEVFLVEGVQIRRHVCTTRFISLCRLNNRLLHRKDLLGWTLNVVFGTYVPFSMKSETGEHYGIVPEILYTMASNLNMTFNISYGTQWGSRQPDGSWSGMLGKSVQSLTRT